MTLLEQYNQRKGAEIGKPASASVQKKEAAKKPRTLLESWQQRNLYAQAQDAPRLYSQPSGAQPGDLYAQALQNGGSESAGQKLYEQRRAQAEQANTDFRSNLLNMFGMGLAAQEAAGMPDQAELAREQIRSGREAQEANRRSRELAKAVDWEGRDELVQQFQEAQALAEYEPSRLNIERATALRKELEQKDEETGNGARAYGLHDRAQAVIRGAEGNIGSSLVSSFGTLGENIAAGEMAREAGSVDQALRDLKTGDNTRKAAEAAMRTPEATAGWQRIHDTADKLGGSAAEDLQKAKEGLSALGQMGVDAAENIIEMGFDAGIAMLTNGAMTAAGKEIWEGASLASMAARSFGGAAQEARQDGATSGEQLLYGLTKAAIEVGTEKLADGVAGIYGKGSADAITEKLIGELAGTNTGRSVLRWLIGALGEGGEEVVSELFAPLAEAIYKDTRFKDFLPFEFEKGEDGGYRLSLTVPKAYQGKAAQILSAFLNGAFVSLISGGAGFVNGQYSNANAELRAQESAARMGEANQNAPQERGAVDVDLEGVLNNEQGIGRGSENRDAGIGAGGQALNNEGGENTGAVDAGNEGGQTGADLQNYVREEVTPAELGISNGSTTAAVRVLDESRFAQGSPEAATAERARQAGLEPVFVLGSMDIGGKQARAYIQGSRVILQADARVTADQLLNHELYHQASQKDPQLNQTLRESLANNLTEEELGALIDRYIQAYDGVYDFSNMTAEQIGAICEEELFADLYAGIDNTGRTELRESAQQSFERAQTEQSMNPEAEREIRGPTEGRASYAGERARTANSSTLQQAEQMENEGRSADEIRQETGWFRGMDGQWRFEISDNEAKYYRNGDARFRRDHPEYARYQELMNQFLTGNLSADELVELQGLEQTWGREQARLRGLVESGHATLDMLLDHPALFDAYPQLREARIRFADMESGERGSYNSRTNSFTLSNELRNAPENTLIHEIQHAIQNYEGFSGGSSPEYWEGQERNGRIEGWKSENTKALEKEYTDLMESLPEETRQLIRECNQAYADGDFERIDALEDQLSESPYGGQYFDLMALEGRIANARDADRKVNAQANYINTAGEIEARDVAGRRSMTEEERKNTPPDLGDENTVFAEKSAVSFDRRVQLDKLDIPWDPDNTSSIKEQVTRSLDYLNTKSPVTEVSYDKTSGKSYYEQLDDTLRTRFGYKIDRQGFGSFLFDKNAISNLRHYVGTDAEAAAAIASPYVLKRGEIISGHRNHNNGQYPSVTFAAPVVLNGETGIEAVTVLFADKDRVHSLRVLSPDGTEFVLLPIKNETELEMAGVNAKAEITQPTSTVSDSIIRASSEESNPQNKGKASVDVGGESLADLRRELQELQTEYSNASAVGDLDYDYESAWGKIKELRAEIEQAAQPENESAQNENESAQRKTVKVGNYEIVDSHPERGPLDENGIRTVKAEDLEDELLDFSAAKVKNDTGEYFAQIRRKKDGRLLAMVDRNGKRDISKSFKDTKEAANWLAGYIEKQTEARTDAELDRHKSEKKRPAGITEALFGQTNPQEEADKRLYNNAAEAATQTLRDRIRRTNAEIQALNRLEKTTGLTDQQKAHREDLQKTLDVMNDELTSWKNKTAEERKAAAERREAEKVKVTGNRPTRSVADARRSLMDLFNTPEGSRNEVGEKIQAKLNEILETGRLTETSRQELFDLLMEEGVVPKQADPTLRQIREDLNGTRIYVSEKDRADFGDGWKELQRKAWGARIFLTNNPSDVKVDTVNAEMADAYGENAFPTDAALSDMLDNLIEKAERGRATKQALKDAIADEAHYTGITEDEIYGDMFNRMTSALEAFAQKAGLEVELKDKTASQLATERKRWMDRQEAAAQRRRESEIQKKVLKGLQRLKKLRGKAAPDIRAQVDEILKDIDTQARFITPSGIEDLKALQRAYEEKAQKEGYVDDDNPGNFLRNPYVEEKLKRLSDKHLGEMDINDVIELGRVVAGIENAIRTQNQMIGEEQDATIKEYADGVDKEIRDAKGAKPGFWQKWFKEEQLSPRRFLEMLGGWKDGYMKKLSQALENGQTRQLDFQRRAMQSFDAFLSKEENRKWLETASGKDAKWTTYGVVNGLAMDGSGITGQTIEITPMMRVALYLHSMNEDNLRHIQTGGLVIPDKALYQKGKIREAYAQGQHVKMQPEAVRAIASQLTQEEKTFAGYLQKFFNETSKQAINEVSMQLDGFERADVEQYFPIESSREYLASDVAGEARAQTVEGIGSIANERVHAGNPIVLSDASEVLLRQIDKVSRYYGYAIPIRNFQAVNNYVFHEEGNAFAGSIKETINRKWGSGAENYITKMLTDLQSSGKGSDMMGSVLAKLRGNLAGATLMANPSVAVSQTASYLGAAQVVGWDGLAHGLTAGKVDTKLIDKYTPLYWYRNQGNSTQELGDSLKQKGLEQKLPWLLNWIQKMDSATVRRLWVAAEYRVSKDNPGLKPGSQAQIDAGTDPYYQKVAEVFNRAVYDTQPNYTTMERAQILRSDSDVTKFLTMYKTVPLQYYGMMTEAAGRLHAAMRSGDKAQIEKAQKYAADTYGGLLAANMVYVAMKALFKGIRGKDDDYKDEEGNLTAASATKQLSKELLEVYAGSVIGGAEALSVAQSLAKGSRFRGPEMSALTHVEDVVNGVVSIRNAVETKDPRKAAGAIKDASENVAMAFGLPVKNVETYTMAMIRRFFPDAAMEYDNVFGGVERGDMKAMNSEAMNTAANIILRNRTGQSLDRGVTDELGRLYAAGFTDAIPTSIPESFKYGDTTVEIKDRKAYGETWGGIVGDNIEELLGSDEYTAASDKVKKSMIDKLYDYATVKARQQADPNYSVTGNSTYGWTEKADECVAAGIDLTDAICAISAIGNMSADKDANGNSISGSKKSKVVDYIDSLDLTDEQKDELFLAVGGYKENTLDETPWHGGSGGRKSSGRRSGGGRGKSNAVSVKPVKVISTGKKQTAASGIDIRDLFGGTGKSKSTDAGAALVEIIDKYYGGNALAAAIDGGRKAKKGRTKVDFRAKV